MDNISVLIVDDSEFVRNSISEFFDGIDEVRIVGAAADGIEAYEMTRALSPDVVILDLVMPRADGYSYLEKLMDVDGERPKVLVLSSMACEASIRRAIDLGADFYMVKPFDYGVLYSRVRMMKYRDIDVIEPMINRARNWDERLREAFGALRLPSHVKGYSYLYEAVRMIVRNGTEEYLLTKEIYPDVAKLHGTTAAKVERSIRNVVEIAWKRGDGPEICEALGVSPEMRPTNGEFIRLMVEKARAERPAYSAHRRPGDGCRMH